MECEQIRELGGALGLNHSKLKRMKELPADMVAAWLREEDYVFSISGHPTWSTLRKALEDMGQTGIAAEIHADSFQATRVPHVVIGRTTGK